MIFEVYIPELDIALGGGGRYDRLIEVFGGDPTPAVGCAHGIDRVAIALQAQKTILDVKVGKTVAVIPITDALKLHGAHHCPETQSCGYKSGV